MRVGTIIAFIGGVALALGGIWYWRLSEVARSFAGTAMINNVQQTQKYAVALACLGLVVVLVGAVVNSLAPDDGA
jgi:hypothetical protein